MDGGVAVDYYVPTRSMIFVEPNWGADTMPSDVYVRIIELSSLFAAAHNIVQKWRRGAELTDADIKWLERAMGGDNG
jgi:hypothetical protein